MKKKSNSLLRTLGFILLILFIIVVYAYGWRVTDIDLSVPQEERRQTQVTRALRGLLSPDIFDRDEATQAAGTSIYVPCQDDLPASPAPPEGEPYLEISPRCGQAKETIEIKGYNFRPYTEGIVRIINPEGDDRAIGRIRTDGEGHFSNSFRIPSVSEEDEPFTIETELSWPVGVPRASDALKTTVDRMIETIFLALMATTFSVFIAIPISFIAAYNIMRQIKTSFGSFMASLIPIPFGWLLGKWAFRPVNQVSLDLGSQVWPGVVSLLGVFTVLYLVFIRRRRVGEYDSPLLAGLVRYARMILLLILFLLFSGIISGLGMQLSVVLEDFLGGLFSNITRSISDFVGLLLPVLAGVSGIIVISSLVSTLLDPLIRKIESDFLHRLLGLILGAVAISILFFLIYRGIFSFYNPGEPAYLTTQFAIAGAILGGGLGLAMGSDYQLPAGLIIYYIVRTTLNALRSIEPLIMAIVFAVWVSIGPFAGVLALTLHSIAALGKLYSEQVENIDEGPMEAITSTGASRLQVIIYGVVPQIVPPYLAFTLYRWDINVRMSTVIGFVGGGGIGFILQQWINLLQYSKAGVAVLAIAIVVATLDYISAQARERIT